jgi:hypothetical protein
LKPQECSYEGRDQFTEGTFSGLPVGCSYCCLRRFLVWGEFLGGAGELDKILTGNRAPVYGALSSIFGSLLGFVITSMSIALALAGNDRLAPIRQSRHYPTLWKVFTASIKAFALATVASLLALVLDRDCIQRPLLLYFCVGAATLACFRLWNCVMVLEHLVTAVATSQATQPPGRH